MCSKPLENFWIIVFQGWNSSDVTTSAVHKIQLVVGPINVLHTFRLVQVQSVELESAEEKLFAVWWDEVDGNGWGEVALNILSKSQLGLAQGEKEAVDQSFGFDPVRREAVYFPSLVRSSEWIEVVLDASVDVMAGASNTMKWLQKE